MTPEWTADDFMNCLVDGGDSVFAELVGYADDELQGFAMHQR